MQMERAGEKKKKTIRLLLVQSVETLRLCILGFIQLPIVHERFAPHQLGQRFVRLLLDTCLRCGRRRSCCCATEAFAFGLGCG